MTEQRLPITAEEQTRRNKLLRWKKHGIQGAVLMLMMVCCAIIYLLQENEHLSGEPLYIITGIATVLLLGGMLLYRRFARLINLDMQSDEKIVMIGIVVRTNFIGNTVYVNNAYGTGDRKYITLDINGRWFNLSGMQLKRLLPEVWQANHIYLHDQFLVEFTPYGRHIMRLDRLT